MTTQTDLATLNTKLASALADANTCFQQINAGTPSSWAAVAAIFAIGSAQQAAAALAADLNPPPPPPPPPPNALVGLWSNGTPASTLGVSPAVISDYADGTNATTYGYDSARSSQQASRRLLLSVGALTPAQATAIAQTLVANGQSSALIRPMWEMNQGGWFPAWNQHALTAAQYISIWNGLHSAFMAVSANFQFIWCQNAGDGSNLAGRTSTDTFPGSSVCNYVGVDIYDSAGGVSASLAQLSKVIAFAKSVGLEWCAPEWGLYNAVDDPAFVQMMQASCGDGSCFMQALFSEVGLTTGPGTDITKTPKSLAAYKAWLG